MAERENEQVKGTGRAVQEPKQFAVRAAGLGCLVAWTYVAFFSKLVHYSTRNDISHLNSTYTFACLGIVVASLAAAFLGHRAHARAQESPAPDAHADLIHRGTPPQARLAHVLAAAGLTLCTVVLCMVERNLFTQPWCSIASTAAGACMGVLYLGWAHVSSRDRDRSTLRLASAFVFAACVFVVILYLPEAAGLVACACLPLASLACLAAAERDTPPHPKRTGRVPQANLATFHRAVGVVAALGFAESLMRALYLEVNPIADTEVYRWMMLGATILGAGLVLGASRKRQGWAAGAGLTKVSMFVMAMLFGLAPIVKGFGIAPDLAVSACYTIVNLVLWTAMAQVCAAYSLPATKVFGIGLGLVYTGFLAGTLTGDVLSSFFTLDMRAQAAIALACMAIVLAALLFVVDERAIVRLMNADDENPAAPEAFMCRCEELANTYGLSPKETEVMALAARGRTNQRIQEALGISAGTVNTHLTRIYKKLGIHSRQEMLDLVEGEG